MAKTPPSEARGCDLISAREANTPHVYVSMCSVLSDSLWPCGVYPPPPGFSVHGIFQARILECHSLLWGVFLTQGSNPCLLHCRQIILPLSYLENPKGNQSLIYIRRTDAEAEAPILWLPDAKTWLIGKDPDAGKDWRWEEKGTTEDEMVGWHHWLDGHEFEQAPGVGDGQGGLVCCSPWGHKELDTTEWLNWTNTWEVPKIPHASPPKRKKKNHKTETVL